MMAVLGRSKYLIPKKLKFLPMFSMDNNIMEIINDLKIIKTILENICKLSQIFI